MPVFLSEDEVKRTGKAIEAWRKDLFTREYLPRVVGFPDVRALFDRLIADGRKVALASSAKGDEIKAYKQAAGIADLELVETSSDDAEKSKPHPDIFEAALDRLKLPPARCVVVGDTPYDAEAARKAGLATVGCCAADFAKATFGTAAQRLSSPTRPTSCITTIAGPRPSRPEVHSKIELAGPAPVSSRPSSRSRTAAAPC